MAMISTVKMKAVMFQPSSDLVFMCRKHTRCTKICTTAIAVIDPRITAGEAAPVITIQNGITVRMTDRIKPVMYVLRCRGMRRRSR